MLCLGTPPVTSQSSTLPEELSENQGICWADQDLLQIQLVGDCVLLELQRTDCCLALGKGSVLRVFLSNCSCVLVTT